MPPLATKAFNLGPTQATSCRAAAAVSEQVAVAQTHDPQRETKDKEVVLGQKDLSKTSIPARLELEQTLTTPRRRWPWNQMANLWQPPMTTPMETSVWSLHHSQRIQKPLNKSNLASSPRGQLQWTRKVLTILWLTKFLIAAIGAAGATPSFTISDRSNQPTSKERLGLTMAAATRLLRTPLKFQRLKRKRRLALAGWAPSCLPTIRLKDSVKKKTFR